MLDHREIFPAGTVLVKNGKETSLWLYGKERGKPRMLASLAIKQKINRYVGVPDIAGEHGELAINHDNYSSKQIEIQNANHEANKGIAIHKEFSQSDTVVLVAPGKVAVEDIEHVQSLKIPIVAISRAADSFFLPDYAVVSDPYPRHTQTQYCSAGGITAVLCTQVHPDISGLKWKDKTWFTHLPRRFDGIPHSCPTEGVVTDAVWFAINGLKAKKVIMLGVEQPATNVNYYWEGVFLQAHCFWYSKHDIEIWNCTPATSVVAGVKLGTLEEACQ